MQALKSKAEKDRPAIPVAEYRRALRFLGPHKARFLPLIGISFLSNVVALVQPYLTKLLIDNAFEHRSFSALKLFALLMGVSAAASFGLGILSTYLYTKLSALVLFDMRLAVFQKLQALSPQFFARTKTGDIVSRLNNDIGELQRLSSDTLLSLPSNILFLIGNMAMMIYLNWKLSIIALMMVPAGIWAMRRYQGRLRAQVRIMREQSAEIGNFLIESILGMRLLVSCNAQERKNNEFRERNDSFVHTLLSMQITSFLASALPGALLSLSVAILFLYGGALVISGSLTLGALIAFMAYQGRLFAPIQSLMSSHSALITGAVSLSRVLELLDKPEEVSDLPHSPVTLDRGAIRFENVSFSYEDRRQVLRDTSFDVPARTACILVGASGAGKSTITDLLLRFYDPSSGNISIDGHDLKNVRLRDLRAAVAIVDQTPFFFHATIRENLLFASPAATKEECDDALRKAALLNFIESLPARCETILGERGLTLSAGQRHRLAIARALLRKPSILILDEPSAALDPNSEFELGQTLCELGGTCTILIITHRPALLDIADQVIVLEDGRIAEGGTPRDLLSSSSALSRHFRDLVPLSV